MVFKKIICISVCCMLLISGTTLGYAEERASCTTTEKDVTITIELGEAFKNENVDIEVLAPTKTVADLLSADPTQRLSVLDNVWQERTNTNGNLTLTYEPNSGPGWYTVRIGSKRIYKPFTVRFPFSSEGNVKSIIEDLNTVAKVEALFNEPATENDLSGYYILGLHESLAFSVFKNTTLCSAVTKQKIYENVLAELTKESKKSDVQKIFEKSVFSQVLYAIRDEAVFANYIKDYGSKLGLDASAVYQKIYLDNTYCNDEVKSKIIANLIGHSWQANESISTVFEESIFIQALNHIKVNSQIGGLLEIASDTLGKQGAKMSVYQQKISSKGEIIRQLADYQFDSLSAFVQGLNTAIDNQLNKEAKITGSTGKNSGSGTNVKFNNTLTQIKDVTPGDVAEVKSPFSDLEQTSWAIAGITYLAQKGVLSGKAEGKFFPNDLMTREEFAKVLVLSLGLPLNTQSNTFEDAYTSGWYYPYVSAITAEGVMNGYGQHFGIGDTITREDMATILYRALTKQGKQLDGENRTFADNDQIADYAKQAINSLCKLGIMNGVGNNMFEPKAPATRAQVAKTVYEILEKMQ